MKHNLLALLMLLFGSVAAIGQVEISGTILDKDSSDPLIGVNIIEQGTTNGTITDIDGSFTLRVKDSQSIIEISYLGYNSLTITVGSQTNFQLTMGLNAAELDEVVVIGYGTQKKKEVTGAITKVTAETLEDMPILRVEDALQGRTSGVRITSNSGQPGESSSVRIRGTTVIGDSEPLYVVDGVPIGGGIDFLNQDDIESIEVLKDAASAGIYGTRASKGVVLITTKKGKKDQMEVNYNAYYGVQSVARKLDLLNATQYATLMNESSVNAGGNIIFDDPESLGVGTDWQDAVFRNNAPMANHNLSISSGGDRSSYFASFGYFDQDGIVSENNSNYQRFTVKLNTTHKINDNITFGNNFSYARIKNQGVSTNSEFGSPLGRAINLDPITPIIETDPEVLNTPVFLNNAVVTNEEGQPYGISNLVTSEILNPVAALAIQQGSGRSDKIVGNVFAEITLFKDFKFRSSGGADLAFWGGEGFTPVHYLNGSNRVDINSYNRSQNRGLKLILENTLTYSKRINLHNISTVIGTVVEKNSGEGQSATIRNIPVNNINDASFLFPTPPEDRTFGGFEYLDKLASYLGRINYSYSEKYLLSLTMRIDGSSKFGTNNKWGYFPGVSVGWIMSDEEFLSNNEFINFLKIRGSWGVNGNNNIGDFRFVSLVGGGRNYVFGLEDLLTNGVSPNAIANPDLRWEETSQLNLGFNAKLMKRLNVTFDVFNKKTTGMLLNIAVPGYVGNAGPDGNIASMENRGVELELGYDNKIGQVSFDISGNVTYLQNEVTFLGEDKEFLPGATFSPQGLEITRISEGEPIGYLYGYKTDGIFQNEAEVMAYTNADGGLIQPDASPGDFRFVDFNDNGIIDPDDRTKIGDPTPTWNFGLNVSMKWKAFDVLLFGQGTAGNDIFKATRRFDLQMANMTADALGRWTGEGTTNTYPRLVRNDPNSNFSRSSDFYVENGSFFRIKTLQLGYNFPLDLLENIGFKKMRIYISGNNLATFTGYSGYDPEINGGIDRGLYPHARFFLFGVNASF
jgi:TonB-linked SusC/RagA family outer membrane protein